MQDVFHQVYIKGAADDSERTLLHAGKPCPNLLLETAEDAGSSNPFLRFPQRTGVYLTI